MGKPGGANGNRGTADIDEWRKPREMPFSSCSALTMPTDGDDDSDGGTRIENTVKSCLWECGNLTLGSSVCLGAGAVMPFTILPHTRLSGHHH